jgi:preprotein translocase subunit SecA
MKKLIYEIKLESNKLSEKSDEEINIILQTIKKRKNKECLDNLIVEWFAIVQEVSYRTIGLRHFDTQLLAGILLHEGKIVEMKTGEGKTLVTTLPVSLNALTEKGVHVVTVNDYLAERDQKWMGKIYKGLNLTVGLVKSTSTLFEKQKSYGADITYVTNSELVFDYLRDSSAYNLKEIVQRPFNFCLIDEIDSILIDEARTPLILSSYKENENINKLYLAKAIANILEKEVHFQLDEKRKDINLTEEGYRETKKRLGIKSLYDPGDPWILDILNALKAKYLFKLNKDYIILNNKIVIVDEFTGRIMEDRRWSMGLHESVEMKEGVKIGGGTKTKSSITYQNFFTLYPTLAGMTGTGKTTEKEFEDIDVTVNEMITIEDIFNDDDFLLLEVDKNLDIFKFKHTPKLIDRAKADYVAQRIPINEKDFQEYEKMFVQVHKEINEGKRKIKTFKNIYKNLIERNFYLMDGILLYFEVVNLGSY